jgi:hypothetical protein
VEKVTTNKRTQHGSSKIITIAIRIIFCTLVILALTVAFTIFTAPAILGFYVSWYFILLYAVFVFAWKLIKFLFETVPFFLFHRMDDILKTMDKDMKTT